METLYAYPSFVGSVSRAESDRKLHTYSSDDITVFKGELVFSTLNGEELIVSETSFNQMIPVRRDNRVERKKFKEMSPFEQQEMANAYGQAWVDNKKYIDDEQKMESNKAF